jgi:hypothetical protein
LGGYMLLWTGWIKAKWIKMEIKGTFIDF